MTTITPVTDLLSALRARLLTTPSLPAARSWENVAFTPELGVPWIADNWIGGQDLPAEVGGAARRGRYLYQLSLYYPSKTGVHAATRLADAIGRTLRASPILISGNPPAYVQAVRVGPSQSEPPNWWFLPLSITIEMDF